MRHHELNKLVEEIKPILGGRHPAMQSIALAELLAIWLAGHDVEVREALLANHIEVVRELLAAKEA